MYVQEHEGTDHNGSMLESDSALHFSGHRPTHFPIALEVVEMLANE